MRDVFYCFFNGAGRRLKVLSGSLVRENPALAEALSPVPLAELPGYAGMPEADVIAGFAQGERAWVFYPGKRDAVRTVFGVTNGAWWVEKRLAPGAARLRRNGFTQLALPRTPVWKGRGVFPASGEVPDEAVRDYFRRLFAAFPMRDGLLPENAVDALPRNCIVETDGTTRFFDLEYAHEGGVRATFLVYRALKMDVLPRRVALRGLSHRRRRGVLRREYGAWCRELGLVSSFREDERLSARFKDFFAGDARRRLTKLLLALVPSRRLRARCAWWSDMVVSS